uniref:Uncharacterized protein n=1 Tax=Clandestinovirus TaxID=2831644 RepID=A0A8F8PJV0_9VIRU|nr:hypothetical protein KOM_12_68 [Clandestinovirus]
MDNREETTDIQSGDYVYENTSENTEMLTDFEFVTDTSMGQGGLYNDQVVDEFSDRTRCFRVKFRVIYKNTGDRQFWFADIHDMNLLGRWIQNKKYEYLFTRDGKIVIKFPVNLFGKVILEPGDRLAIECAWRYNLGAVYVRFAKRAIPSYSIDTNGHYFPRLSRECSLDINRLTESVDVHGDDMAVLLLTRSPLASATVTDKKGQTETRIPDEDVVSLKVENTRVGYIFFRSKEYSLSDVQRMLRNPTCITDHIQPLALPNLTFKFRFDESQLDDDFVCTILVLQITTIDDPPPSDRVMAERCITYDKVVLREL